METTQDSAVRGEGRVGRRGRLVRAGLLAALVAAATNAAVYLVATAAGAMPQDVVVNGQGPITLPMVVTMSVLGAIGGTVVYALIGRFARRPVRVFRVVAAVALVLSFGGPFSIAGAPAAMIVTLLLMHVVAAAVVVGSLTTLARRGARA
jgi:hypothetical protein